MKIAILLPGQTRTYKKCYDNYLSQFENYECDVYSSTWDIQGQVRVKTYNNEFENRYFSSKPTSDVYDELHELYNFKSFEVENYDEWLESYLDNIIEFKKNHPNVNKSMLTNGIFAQYYKIKKTFDLIENPNDYDIIVKYRYDIQSEPIELVKNNNYNCGILTHETFPTDWYFYGNSSVMSIACNMIDWFSELKPYNPLEVSNGEQPTYTPEQIMGFYLKSKNINVNNLETNPKPIR